MKQTASSRKVNEVAREKIAAILLFDIADPRLRGLTVTGCEVSTDRALCLVYISTDKERYEEARTGLESAKGRVRSLLGKGLGWRVTPELRFLIDTSVDEAERISVALKQVPATLHIEKDEHGQPIGEQDDE
jgi:ribosome-binding factor A